MVSESTLLYALLCSLLSTLYSTLYSALHATFYSLLVGSIRGSLTFVNVHECCSVILESCNTKVTLQSMRCLFPLHWAWTKWHTSKANWLPMASHTGPLWRDSLCDLHGKTLFLRENVWQKCIRWLEIHQVSNMEKQCRDLVTCHIEIVSPPGSLPS